MATGADWNCPICHEASSNIAYVGNCLHQFCQSCIQRWAKEKPSCPLCRQTLHTIIYPVGPNNDFVETAMPQLWELPSAAEPLPQGRVEELSPETWALCFRTHAEILRPVELWLQRVLCGACWWDVAFARGRIMGSLCRYGLHEEALVRELQPVLRDQTPIFVRRLIEVASDHCSALARRYVGTARPQAEPGTATLPGTSPAPEPRREGSGPRREGSGPRLEGSGPRREGSGPRLEGSGPRREGSGPRREGSGPRLEGSGPRREGSGPRLEGSGPRREGSGPRLEGSGPRREGSGPRRGVSGPRREGSGPRREGSGPRRGVSGPRREGSGPRRGVSGPRRGVSGPRREGSGPRREGSEPAGPSVAARSGRSGAEAATQSRRCRVGSRERGATQKKRWRRQN